MRDPVPSSRQPLFSGRDLTEALLVPVFAAAAWLLPSKAWSLPAWAVSKLNRLRGDGRHHCIRTVLGDDLSPEEARRIDDRIVFEGGLHRMHVLGEAGVTRPPPHLKIVGTEHLDAALQAGRGGILWVSLFCHAALMSRRALREAGYVVNHLSGPEHGEPDTSLGRRFLAPLHQLIEDRFLASRVTLQPGGTTRAMRELIRKLQRNEFVSITVLGAGVQTVEVPFLNSSISLARGPVTLGLRTGAPVLPSSPCGWPPTGSRSQSFHRWT